MKTASIAATVSTLLSIAIAQPHNHHARHNALHEKRAIVWETTVDIVWETVDVTTTITVPPGQVTSTVSSVVQATPASASASSAVQFIQPASPSSVVPIATPSTLSIAPAPVPTTSSAVAAAPPTTLVPVVAPPAPASSSPAVAVVPTTTAAEAPVPVSTDAPATVCTSGSPCSGDITWYQTGLGSCGWNNATTESVVALSHFLMGTQSNNGEGGMNPYCGKTISINFGDATTTAVVVDTCEGCNYTSIDLSPAVFSNLDDLGAGRIQGTWHFED